MKIDVITLFPELFTSPLSIGLVGKAIASKAASVDFIDPRAFTSDAHRTVDDAPYGGGGGMVMKVEPLADAIAKARENGPGPVVMMTPQGRPLRQADLRRWSSGPHLVLLAGRYEGFDERVRDLVDEEVSLGDFVLTGGEYAALAIIDGVVRLLPGTLGNAASSEEDSFSDGLLEHPQYTRPLEYGGTTVPDVLMSGHHERVRAWRHAVALQRTRARRPDLFEDRLLDEADRVALTTRVPPYVLGVPFAADEAGDARVFVAFEGGRTDAELAALLRVAAAYGVEGLFWVAGEASQVAGLPPITLPIPDVRPKRKRRGRPPTARIEPSRAIEVIAAWDDLPPDLVRWGASGAGAPIVDRAARPDAVCLCFGAPDVTLAGHLVPIRNVSAIAALPLVAVVAAQLERVVGEG